MKTFRDYSFPSQIVSVTFLMDIVCRCIDGATLDNLVSYTGKSKSYVKNALIAALTLELVVEEDNKYLAVSECANILSNTPTEELKIEVFKSWLQKLEPFVVFMQYISSGDSISLAIRKMTSFYSFNRSVSTVGKILSSWGKGVGLIDKNGHPCVHTFEPVNFVDIDSIRAEVERDAAIRLYLTEQLSVEIYSWLSHDEIEELVSSLKKHQSDARTSIGCAGRALEDILRRVASDSTLDVSKKHGINQIANYLYSHRDDSGQLLSSIHSKQYNTAQALGDIRNMAGHSKEAKTMERWDITMSGAVGYIHLTLSLIKSLYYYTKKKIYTF